MPGTGSDSRETLQKEVRYLKGVGPARAEKLARLGIHTVEDVLYHAPRDYEDRREITSILEAQPGESCVISGTITRPNFRRTRNPRRGILEVGVNDGTGFIKLIWFNARRSWRSSFPSGETITAYGEIDTYRGLQMVAPDYSVGEEPRESDICGGVLPVYPLTEGIYQKVMRKITRRALDEAAGEVPELLPESYRERREVTGIRRALWHLHYPPDLDAAEEARRRLGYEELFVFQSALGMRRAAVRQEPGYSFRVGPNVDEHIRRLFPFEFTSAQEKVVEEIAGDMRSEQPMNRLLQGDVGCGKTVVAVYAMLAALAESSRGMQAALMAPTEVLAEQHYLTLQSLLERAEVKTALLKGGAEGKREMLDDIADGDVDLVVGTHALIQEDVKFNKLGLIVVDEQHRFGVEQRLALGRKGTRPDVLIMTATPIPRSLALAYLSDMDVSVIDEMPPGREPVHTEALPPARWKEGYEGALEELEEGYSVFVVLPLLECSEELGLSGARHACEKLQDGLFADYECCLLHGRMSTEKKRQVMELFRTGECRVLVATTVVEVGIDVPEATAMIVQHAERLGLAQLHQLRGRVGRGDRRGLCYLLASPETEEAERRMEVLTDTTDGFRIAEEDLRLRGPGKFFGTEQSGMPDFKFCDFSDTRLLKAARKDALELVDAAPELEDHGGLRQEIYRRYGRGFVFAGVG